MKIKINGIDIECTPSECAEFIKAMSGTTSPPNTQNFPNGLSSNSIIKVTKSDATWFTFGKYYLVKCNSSDDLVIFDDDGDEWILDVLNSYSDTFEYKIVS